MLYKSTRGDSTNRHSFEEAVCGGYAPDGGLYVPESLPKIDHTTLNEWKTLTYIELATQVLRNFISEDEISNKELSILCQASVEGFDNKNHPVVVKPLGGPSSSSKDNNNNVFVSELFHGPTMCFKDFGLRFLIQVLSYFCTKRQKARTILVATTGDTGPAALASVCDANNPLLSIIIHYPHGQVSDFQRKQLTTIRSSRHYVVAFKGGGDDMDLPIKNILTKQNVKADQSSSDSSTSICGVNSYNIARPLMQMVHFIWTYLRIIEQLNKNSGDDEFELDFVIPTGAMGNIVAAHMSKLCGIPIGIICAAVNVNDVSYRVITSGEFYKSPTMKRTLSEAINIQLPYNFERLLYYLTNEDHDFINKSYTQMEQQQEQALSKIMLDPTTHTKLKEQFKSARITDAEMCRTLKKMYAVYKYVCDPHTSIAVACAAKLGYMPNAYDSSIIDTDNNRHVCIFATASPCKFEEVIKKTDEVIWDEYYNSDEFPKKAKQIALEDEIPPIVYDWPADSMSLINAQSIWEKNTSNLIDKLIH